MQRSTSGFTLVEVIAATGILVTVAAGTAQLFGIAIRHELDSRQQLAMAAAAAAKIDELAGTTAVTPEPSAAAGALDRSVDGYADTVTASGFALWRRWILSPVGEAPSGAVVIVVRVGVGAGAWPDYEIATIAEARTP